MSRLKPNRVPASLLFLAGYGVQFTFPRLIGRCSLRCQVPFASSVECDIRVKMTFDRQGKNLTYDFDELTIWRTKLPDVKHAILPPSNNRPNPRVIDGLVVVSVFAPGAICALDRKTGLLVWRREFPKFASAAVYDANGTLFANTPNTLHALEPETGNTVWSFCPHGDSGETMYSAPRFTKTAS